MSVVEIKDKQFEIFITEEQIFAEIRRIAEQITLDLRYKNPLLVCVLNGAFMFASDLIKCLNFPCEVTFIRLKSYEGVSSQGGVKEIHGLIESVEGRNVLVIEDIVDTGLTIKHLKSRLQQDNPSSLKVATLLFKPAAVQVDVKPDYVALEIPNDFIVGYGLDYDGQGRNFRDIYKIKE